jgi:deoxyribodipyrimidine photo-lyase
MIELEKNSRIRIANDKPFLLERPILLYWMQANRRLAWNHSLDYAILLAQKLDKELVVYEGLRMDYLWNSSRIHKFILEGFIDNYSEASKLGINYWSFLETKNNPAKGILKKVSTLACAIVTDDFPCFIIPEQIKKLSEKIECKLIAVDGNSINPIGSYGNFASAARILRPRMHKQFTENYIKRANPVYSKSKLATLNKTKISPPFLHWSGSEKELFNCLNEISFANNIPSYSSVRGGRKEGLRILNDFIEKKLFRYATDRSNPSDPNHVAVSSLSPYLHFGYISAEEVITAVLDSCEMITTKGKSSQWAPDRLNFSFQGKNQNFFSSIPSIDSFLDELITWRDIGYQLFWQKPEFRKGLECLPDWAKNNFEIHKKDKREFNYTREEWVLGKTHDPIWNSAQKELYSTGRMHNYMRMLWGKKIIEWSPSIEDAYNLMEDLNNLYAYDGRNPNSYSGILWCFGLFDRPWFPERNVLGNVRYMSSDSTRKKFKLTTYLNYVEKISNPQGVLF